MNLFHCFLILLITNILSFSIQAQVVINEYSCSNSTTISDNYGNYEDWIELYNSSGSAISIAGYYFSDKASNPTKWQVPAGVNVPANGFLKIWCSGKNEFLATNVHTNFKLTQTKPERIIFSNTLGTILENYILNPTQNNHSRGRTTNGAATWSIFTTPTPGASNSSPKQEYASKPSFDQTSGFYSSAITLTISTPDANITIRYTTDGNEPTSTSTIYSTPINISSTQVIRAKAFSSIANIPPSFTNSNTYFINENHSIAVISVFGDDVDDLFSGIYVDADAGLEYFDVTNTLRAEATGVTNKHGNDSWAYDQRGIDFVCKDQYGDKYSLLWQLFNQKPRNEFQRIILKAAANDNYPFEAGGAHVRDQYVTTLSQLGDLHLDGRTYEPCIVFMNGQYWGVYDMREKVDDADFTEYYFNSDADNVQMLKTWGGTWSEYGGTQAQTDWDNLLNFILSNNMAIPANYNYVDSLYNVKSLVDYFVLNSYVVCSDWLNWNTEWWRGINPNASKKKWRYALWDEDATFGHYINYTGVPTQTPDADPCSPEQLGDPGGQGHVPILNALMDNAVFKQYYISRFADLSNTSFKCDRMIFVLDSLINLFLPEMPNQISRWGGTMAEWQQNVQDLKDYINDRCSQIQSGMNSCYNLTGPYSLTFDVYPPNSGTLNINSVSAPNYPWSATYYGGVLTLMKAQANAGYEFDYWESLDPVSLGINDDSVSVSFTQTQNVIAHFKLINLPLTATIVGSNPFCYGGFGSADLTVTGDTAYTGSYYYQWSNGATTEDISNISAGIYTVTVSDNDTSSVTASVTITEPDSLIISTSFDTTIICKGFSVTLSESATGGTTPYIWYWDGIISTSTIIVSPTSNTNYIAKVIDNNNCISTKQITVSVSPDIFLSASVQNVKCFGDCSGQVAVSPYGSIEPYSYQWSVSAGNQTNATAISLCEGTHYVTVTNGDGCFIDSIFTISQPTELSYSVSITNVSCFDFDDGQILLNVLGGTSPYNYLWSNNSNSQNLVAIVAGNYSATVTDSNLCSMYSSQVTVAQPASALSVLTNIVPEDTICIGSSIQITSLASGGTSPYSYIWKNDQGLTISSSSTLTTNPTSNTYYYLSVTDNNGCVITETKNIYVSPLLTVSSTSEDITCNNLCNGKASLSIFGGVTPYTYSWASSTNQLTGLCSGFYEVTVTDSFGCSDSASFTISEPTQMNYILSHNEPKCFNSIDGEISVNVSGGIQPYTYNWSNGTSIINTLICSKGNYTVTVTDFNSCTLIINDSLDAPSEIKLSVSNDVKICIGQSTILSTQVFGGSPGYNYHWFSNQDSSVSNLNMSSINVSPDTTQTYFVNVSDANNCLSSTQNIIVSFYSPISANITTSNQSICPNEELTINAIINGGNGGPYKCFLQDGTLVTVPFIISSDSSDILITYTLNVNDLCGSPKGIDSIIITVLPSPPINFNSDTIAGCQPLTVQFNESSPNENQTYFWNLNSNTSVTSLSKFPKYTYKEVGEYDISLTVKSVNGCESKLTKEKMITVYEKPKADFIADPETASIVISNIYFDNRSINAIKYSWDFGDNNFSDEINPTHTFSEVNEYLVELIVESEEGCKDTTNSKIIIKDEYTFFAPTAFVLGDGEINNTFFVCGSGINPNNFKLIIYDRWGEIVFETNEYDAEFPKLNGWDGKIKGNNYGTSGVYTWIAIYKDTKGAEHNRSGFVTLIR